MLAVSSVSVCIPVHDDAKVLTETVRSVLDQTYRDFELVVLDNASSDASGRIARTFRDPRVRVERSATVLTEADSWGTAVQLCRAPLVKLVAPGDLLHPRCLELQVPPMDHDPGLALVVARRHVVDDVSRVVVPRRGLHGLTGVRTGVEVARRVVRTGTDPTGPPCAVLFRRDHFAAAGGWHAARRPVMDLDLWLRLLEYGEFLGLPQALAAVRLARAAATDDAQARDRRQELVDELRAASRYRVRRADVAVGRVAAPLGRARRRALWAVAGAGAGRAGRRAARRSGAERRGPTAVQPSYERGGGAG